MARRNFYVDDHDKDEIEFWLVSINHIYQETTVFIPGEAVKVAEKQAETYSAKFATYKITRLPRPAEVITGDEPGVWFVFAITDHLQPLAVLSLPPDEEYPYLVVRGLYWGSQPFDRTDEGSLTTTFLHELQFYPYQTTDDLKTLSDWAVGLHEAELASHFGKLFDS